MNFFRRHLNSKVTKIIALIIVIIFVSWEFISSMLRNKSFWLIKVGEIEYKLQDWEINYKTLIRDPLSIQEAIANPRYAKKRVLEEMIRNALLIQEAQSIGFNVNEKMAANEIVHMHVFKGENGKFDKNKLEEILKSNNISESVFMKNMKEDILRNQLLDIFYNTSGIMSTATYDIFVKLLAAEQNIALYQIPLIQETVNYTLNDLHEFVKQNQKNFTYDDEAEIKTLIFSPDILKNIDISMQEIQEYYEKNSIVEPEKRVVNQIVIKDYNEAVKILKKIRSKELTYDDIAKQYIDQQLIPYEVGPFTAREFDENISKVIFALPNQGISEIIQTPIGWHIFRIKSIDAEQKKNLSEVRENIINLLLEKKINTKMHDIANDIVNDIQNELLIEDIAKKYDVMINHAIQKSSDMNNNNNQDGFIIQDIARAAFVQEDDLKIKLINSKDKKSFMLIQTINITKGQLMEFETIKNRVIEQYIDQQLHTKTQEIAKSYRDEIINELNNKQIDDKKIFKNVRFSRLNTSNDMPPCIQNFIINMHTNSLFSGITNICSNNKAYYFAMLKDMDFSVELPQDKQSAIKDIVYKLYNEIIFDAFIQSLKKKYKIELNEQFEKYLNQ